MDVWLLAGLIMKLELVTNEEGGLGWVGEAGARRQAGRE